MLFLIGMVAFWHKGQRRSVISLMMAAAFGLALFSGGVRAAPVASTSTAASSTSSTAVASSSSAAKTASTASVQSSSKAVSVNAAATAAKSAESAKTVQTQKAQTSKQSVSSSVKTPVQSSSSSVKASTPSQASSSLSAASRKMEPVVSKSQSSKNMTTMTAIQNDSAAKLAAAAKKAVTYSDSTDTSSANTAVAAKTVESTQSFNTYQKSLTKANYRSLFTNLAVDSTSTGQEVPVTISGLEVTLNGQKLDPSSHVNASQHDYFHVKFKFLPGTSNVHQGDYFNVTIPNFTFATTQPYTIAIMTQDGKQVANAYFPANQDYAKVVFTQGSEAFGSDSPGSVEFDVVVDTTKVPNNGTSPINIDINKNVNSFGNIDYHQTTEDEHEVLGKNRWSSQSATIGSYHGIPTSYNIRVNYKKTKSLKNAVVTDKLESPYAHYSLNTVVPGLGVTQPGIVVQKGYYDSSNSWHAVTTEFISASKITINHATNNSGQTVETITIPVGDVNVAGAANGGDQPIAQIFYNVTYDDNYVPVINNGNPFAINTATLNADGLQPITYVSNSRVTDSSGSITGRFFRIIAVKHDENNKPLAGATFRLVGYDETGTPITFSNGQTYMDATTDSNGEAIFSRSLHYAYTITEITPPAGYALNSTPITVTTSDLNSNLPHVGNVYTYTAPAIKDKKLVTFKVTKVWADNNNQDGNRPSSVVVDLLANGNPTGQKLTLDSSSNWSGSFSNLQPTDSSGNDITYSVREEAVTGYNDPAISGNTTQGYTITNTPAVTSVTVKKVWVDGNNQDGIRPAKVTAQIKNGNTVVKTVVLDVDNNWTATVSGLPEYANGSKVNYTVDEASVADGYTKTVEGNTITNTHTPAVIPVTVTKVWADNNNQDGIRPTSVTAQIKNGNTVVKTVVLNAANNWTATVTGLPEYANGQKITYTADEVSVADGYRKSVSGTTITNTHIPAVTSVTVNKVWVDGNNQDGIRPTEVTAQIKNGNTVVKTVVLNAANNWQATVTGLPEYANGQKINYTVDEASVDSRYTKSIEGNTITNTHTPAVTSVTVNKVWVDGNNQDGIRPTEVTAQIKNGNTVVKTVVLNAANNWQATVTGLPEYANGSKINYTVDEASVADGYTKTVEDNTITNTHTPAVTSVAVNKVWADNNNQDGIRPSSVTAQIKNGNTVVKTVVLNAANNWTATVTGLPEYANGSKINYTVDEASVADGYTKTVEGNTITNTHTPAVIPVTVTKVWVDGNNQDGIRPTEVTAQIKNGNTVVKTVVLNAANNWTATVTGLPEYANGSKINYTVDEASVADGYTKTVEGNTITNTHKVAKTSVSVKKVWADDNDRDGLRAKSVVINLLADGKATGQNVTLNAANNWTASFDNLAVNSNGHAIKYTVSEDAVPGYPHVAITGNAKDGYTVTNTHDLAKTSVGVKKVWADDNDRDGVRPSSVVVNLLADGKATGQTVTLNAANNWTASFDNLNRYENQGKEIAYTVSENAVDGYKAVITGDAANGYVVTNNHDLAKTSVGVKKVWADDNDRDGLRTKSVVINLLADGQATGKTVTLSAANNWTASFDNLNLYENQGKKIAYTVSENAVDGYQAVITGDAANGYVVTNNHDLAKTSVGVKKVWADDNDRDGVRPSSVVVNLLADGKATGKTVTLSAANNWTASFDNLNLNENHGNPIQYTVTEDNVPEYNVAITGSAKDGYTVTNTHDLAKTSIGVKKVWADDNDRDGLRAKSVVINLLADGKATGKTVTLNAANNWTASFGNLNLYENQGKKIAYTVSENAVDGYQAAVTGDAAKGYVVTNTHTPAVTSVTVNKVWADNNNQDGVRPASVVINLLADGQATGKTVTLNAANNWTASFDSLNLYENQGKKIAYTVSENAVDGYQAAITGDAAKGYVVTNTHTPAVTSVTVNKVWADNNNQDGIRPASVTAQIKNGNTVVETVVLNEGNNWTATVSGLPVYANGSKINYTVDEASVADGYTKTVAGNTITNTHTPATTAVRVNKVWNDSNNQDGIRPASVVVSLLANGQATGQTVTLDASNNWTAEFTGLPEFEAGRKISYTVDELNVPAGYTKAIAANGDNDFTITNSHTVVPKKPEQPQNPQPEQPTTPTQPKNPANETPENPNDNSQKNDFKDKKHTGSKNPNADNSKKSDSSSAHPNRNTLTDKTTVSKHESTKVQTRTPKSASVTGQPAQSVQGQGHGHGKNTGLPQTGDQSAAGLMGLILAVMGLLVLAGTRRRFD